ncbi:efflux RND transporter periplasmic adaptor subunit [Clostridium aciditolerans]|uniref:Efflux RND transporter periplasmic adaptor subunit n=1 Tax=Clostridium aciditolerans TaxID=339861 RepID=A0A934HWD8_9CLOT|nr:efflux RND transporter periplasmic adaptor subunit [Clostridium aciditolerans]MBI6871570.1 efflux RND transporter periplasmic adaptor subunit [Clostridium aciditolerans]
MKKVTISIMIIAVLGFGGFGVYKSINANAATQSKTSQIVKAKASVQNIQKSVSGSGSVESSSTDTLKSSSRDTIQSVLVSKNQVVTKGQELITFVNGSDPIVAPYDGVISDISVSSGDSVNASQQLMTIFDDKNLLTKISVDETDLANLKVGQKADIKVNAFPDVKFTGVIKDISQQGTYSNGVSNFDVTIAFDDIHDTKVGMSTEATIVTASKENVLAVPVEAVKEIKGEKYVLVFKDNTTPTLQKVELGISNGRMVEITNGLVAGQEIELPQVQNSNNNSSKMRGMGGFQMMQGGGSGGRNNRTSGGQGNSQGK